MADYDYSRAVATATRQINKYGRLVSFRTVGKVVDAANPLAGPVDNPTNTTAVKGVFVELSSLSTLGISKRAAELMKTSEQVLMLAPSAIDYEKQTQMIEADGSVWKIDMTDKLMPGPVPVLYYIGVSRA